MRANEFIREDEKLDEILPLLPAVAGGIARGVVGGAAKAVGGALGKAAVKGVGAVAKGAAKAVGGAVKTVANTVTGGDKEEDAPEVDAAKDQMIRPGKSLKLPTKTAGGPSDFKVSRVQGDEVEIENPDAAKNPGEPAKVVYKKDDLKKNMAV